MSYRYQPALLIALAFLVPFSSGFRAPATPMDEGMALVYPELLMKGRVPYSDFETFYGPANIGVLAGVYSLLGVSVFTERTVGLIYRLVILFAILFLTRRFGEWISTGCMAVAGLLLASTGLVAYAWMGGLACALWALFFAQRGDSIRRCALAGLLAGGALLYRIDLGLAMLAGSLPLFLYMNRAGKFTYLAGGILALTPLLILCLVAGPTQLVDNLFLLPVLHANASRRLPLSFVETSTLFLFGLHLVACLFNLSAGILSLLKPRTIESWLPLSLALFSLFLTHQAAQRCDEMHVLFAAVCSIALLPLSAVILVSHRWPNNEKTVAIAVLSVILVIEAWIPAQLISLRRAFFATLSPRGYGATKVGYEGRSLPVESDVAQPMEEVISTLARLSAPGQRLFVGPCDLRRTNYNDTYFYHLLPKLEPASYFLEMNPSSANRPNSRLAGDIGTADWLLLDHRWDNAEEPNRSRDFGPDEPNATVRSGFELVGEYGPYVLMKRADHEP